MVKCWLRDQPKFLYDIMNPSNLSVHKNIAVHFQFSHRLTSSCCITLHENIDVVTPIGVRWSVVLF